MAAEAQREQGARRARWLRSDRILCASTHGADVAFLNASGSFPHVEELSAEQQAALDRLQGECFVFIERHTLPFWGLDDGSAFQYGSGILLRIAHCRFIVTAAHTLDMITIHDVPTYFPGFEGTDGVHFGERRCMTSTMPASGERNDDPIDTAIIEVDEDFISQLPGRRCVTLQQIDRFDTSQTTDLYMVVGYPSWEARTNDVMRIAQAQPRGYVGNPMEEQQPPPFKGFDPRENIAISLELDEVPNPGGISGCGIWRLVRNDGSPGWSTGDIKLVGIEHTASDRGRILCGTRIEWALRMIAEQHPELKPLLYPTPTLTIHIKPHRR